MVTIKELRIRQMIWAEQRAGTSKEQARLNVNSKLAPDAISQQIIDELYQRFNSGDISLFDNGTKQREIIQAIQTLPSGNENYFVDTILLASDDRRLISKMLETDGRLAIFRFDKVGDTKMFFCDLFHGEIKEITITPQMDYGRIESLIMIGQQHLLAKTHNGLILLKIGIGTWEVGVVSNPNPGLGSHYHIVIDQLDEYSVLIHDEHEFVRGKLVGDGIVFSPRQEFNIGYLKCEKLAGHLLHGCNSWKVYKIDLNTMTKESVDLPIPSGDVFLMFGYMNNGHFRAGNRVYVVFYHCRDRRQHIFGLDTETLTWIDTGIVVYGRIDQLVVDVDGILSFQAFDHRSAKPTFYRFPLKKPDSLKNLAWLTIRRSAILFDSSLYEKIRNRLPYGHNLRSVFISDYK